jgi:hypothetical protein
VPTTHLPTSTLDGMTSHPDTLARPGLVTSKRQKTSPINILLVALAILSFSFFWRVDYLWLEALLLIATLAVSAIFKINWTASPPTWCGVFRRISRRPVLACLIPAVLSAVLRLALLPWVPVPNPVVPDEFSHLFLAKTFLAGRLANPGHPLWQYFETIHILSLPTTFSSMYPPGPALFLALGKLVTGEFFGGVLFGTAFFCAALTWFLRSCIPPGWAFYGGILAAVRFGASSYWNNSYWGGSVPAAAGALLLGAYWRLRRKWTVGPACAFAIATALLANTRPYEGAGFVGALVFALAYEAIKRRTKFEWPRSALALAAACLILAFAGVLMMREWKAVTGSAFTMPYQLNQKVYGWPMTVPWSHPKPVEYRHRELELYRNWEMEEHELITNPAKILLGVISTFSFLWRFFFGISLSAALVFARQILKSRRLQVVWFCSGFVLLQVFSEQSGYPHYASPIAAAFVLFAIQGLRRVSHGEWGTLPAGAIIARSTIPVLFAILAVRAVQHAPGTRPSASPNDVSWCCTDARLRDRTWLVKRLEREPGDHLVLVRYDLERYDTLEWVYNEPDPDRSKVVFARDMGLQRNAEILRYYQGRTVWQAFIKDKQATLSLLASALVPDRTSSAQEVPHGR